MSALFFLLLNVGNVNAQYGAYLDSLKNDLASVKDDTTRVSKLNLLCYAALDPKEQMDYAQRALAIAERIGYIKGKGDALNNIGYVYHNSGDIVKAMENFQQAYSVCKSINYLGGIASSLNNTGWIYYNIGNVSKGLENFQQALLIDEKFNDVESKVGVGTLLNNIAFIYQAQKDYAKALDYYQRSCNVRAEIHDSIGMSASLVNMGAVYRAEGNILKGMEYAQRGLAIVKNIGDKESIANALNSIGLMYEAEDSMSQALTFYHKALGIFEEIGHKQLTASVLANMGYNFYKQKNYTEAENYCSRSFKLAKELGFPEHITKVSHWLSDIYVAQGKYKEAYEMYTVFKQYSDSIFNSGNTKKLTQLQMQYDFDKQSDSLKQQEELTGEQLKQQVLLAKQQQQQLELGANELVITKKEKDLQILAYLKSQEDLENEQLEKKGKEKQLALSEKEKQLQQVTVKGLSQQQVLGKLRLQQQWIYSIGILILLGLLSSWFIYRNRLKEGRLTIELAKQKEAQETKEASFQRNLADISLTALRSQMNPHFIFNCLNSIKLYTTQNDTTAASEYLTKFSKLIRLVMENSRNDRISLAAELNALRLYMDMEAMRFKEKLQYHIQVENDVEADYIEIPPLLLQPYVENSIWHGLMHKEQGGKIDIDVSMKNEKSLLEINIIDNGIGREKAGEIRSKMATRHKSYGMKVTSERIALINQIYKTGANVSIHDLIHGNGQSAGTRVTIQIPI